MSGQETLVITDGHLYLSSWVCLKLTPVLLPSELAALHMEFLQLLQFLHAEILYVLYYTGI